MSFEVFKIELVIRKKQTDLVNTPFQYLEVLNEYKTIENEDRLVADVPLDWDGFKNGTIVDMLRYFNEALYVAIAYFTDDVSIIVRDFDGNSVDKYEEIVNGVKTIKYVKKRLMIVKVLDKDSDKFEIKGYLLDLKFTDLLVKVLDVYSVGKDSGFNLKNFNISI